MSALGQKRTLKRLQSMSALPPKADIAECDWRGVPIGDSGSAASESITSLAALSRRLFPGRCEELQCDSRKATFSAANKAEAVSAECNPLVWNGIFMATFWAYCKLHEQTHAFPNITFEGMICIKKMVISKSGNRPASKPNPK